MFGPNCLRAPKPPPVNWATTGRVRKGEPIGILPFGRVGISQFFKSPFQREFLAGVTQACEEQGVGLSLMSGQDDQEVWGVKNALVDGFIFTGVDQVSLLAGKRRRPPFVVMDINVPDIKSCGQIKDAPEPTK